MGIVAAHLLHVPLPLVVYGLTALLPFLTGDDLQNTQNCNKQSSLVFFSPSQIWFLWVCFSVCFFFPSFSSGKSIMEEPTLGGGRRCCFDGEGDTVAQGEGHRC
jgi:hypothetical protein